MCKIVAYMRVSTPDVKDKDKNGEGSDKERVYEKRAKQDYERQLYILKQSGINFTKIYEEHISGGVKGNQRDEFNKMLQTLEAKDTVCFTETSRFGRNYIDCFDMLDIITQKIGANVKFLSNGIELEGGSKMNPYTWLSISNFFVMDEFLKRQIGYNTANTLRAKKEQGIVLGRPKVIDDSTRQKVLELHKSGKTLREIAEITGVSAATAGRTIRGKR